MPGAEDAQPPGRGQSETFGLAAFYPDDMDQYRNEGSENSEPQCGLSPGLSILVNTLPNFEHSEFNRFDASAVAYREAPLHTPDEEEWTFDDLLDGAADEYPTFRLFANEKAKETILLHPRLINPHKMEGHLDGQFEALFDTGCSKSFISMTLLKQLMAQLPEHARRRFRVRPVPVPHQVVLGDGKSKLPTLIEHQCTLFFDFEVQGRKYSEMDLAILDMDCMNAFGTELVIGSDFTNIHKPLVDWNGVRSRITGFQISNQAANSRHTERAKNNAVEILFNPNEFARMRRMLLHGGYDLSPSEQARDLVLQFRILHTPETDNPREQLHCMRNMHTVPADETDMDGPPPLVQDDVYTSGAPLGDTPIGNFDNISQTREGVHELITERLFPDTFRQQVEKTLPSTRPVISLELKDPNCTPHRGYTRRLSGAELDAVKRAVAEMLENGVIRPCKSDWNSSLLLIPRKNEPQNPRIVLDHRGLNMALRGDVQGLPLIDELIDDATRGNSVFSAIDYRQGFYQLGLDPGSQYLTAFKALGGTWCFTRLSMGLSVAAQSFQRWVQDLFADEIFGKTEMTDDGPVTSRPILFQYLDDGLIATPCVDSHWLALNTIMTRLANNGICLKASKCHFFKSSVVYLGHRISHGKRQMDESKVAILKNMKLPSSKSHLRTMLGMASFYRGYVPGYANLVMPLEEQIKNHAPQALTWPPLQREAFEKLKTALVDATALHTFDASLPIVLDTDASDYAYGALLLNEVTDANGKTSLRPCLMFSSKFDSTQRRWSTTRKEQHGIRAAVQHFHYALHGAKHPVRVRTDHMAATYLLTKKLPFPTEEEHRVIQALSPYELKFEYLEGPKNQAADWLSRSIYVPRENIPVITVWDCMSGMGTVLRAIERCSGQIEPNFTIRYLATDTSPHAQQATADVASRVLAGQPNILLKSPPHIYIKKPRGGKKPPALHDLREIVAAWTQYPSSVPFVDFASFGTPCQPWSRAGEHKGFKDKRDLFPTVLEAIRLLQKKNKNLLFMVECTLFHHKLQTELKDITESFKKLGARRELHDLQYVIPSNRQRYTWTNIFTEARTQRCEGWKSWSDCLTDATAPKEVAPCVMARQKTRSERSKNGEVPAAFVKCNKTGKHRQMSMQERELVQGAHPGDCQVPKAPISIHQSLLGNSFPIQCSAM